jgi:hypothetical protein
MADYSIEVAIPNVGPQGPQGPAGEFGDLEAPEDGIIYGRKDAEWVDMTAPANLQVRRGTAAEVAAITPLEGEPVWATDTKRLFVGDGASLGGRPVTVVEFAYHTQNVILDDPINDLLRDPFLFLSVPPLSRHAITLVVPLAFGPDITSLSAQIGSVSGGAFSPFPTGVSVSGLWSRIDSAGNFANTGTALESLEEIATFDSNVSPGNEFVIVQHGLVNNTTANSTVLQLYWQLNDVDITILQGAYLKLERMN